MSDNTAASFVLMAGAVGIGVWWYHLSAAERSGLLHQNAQEQGSGGRTASLGGPPANPLNSNGAGSTDALSRLLGFASAEGLTVTSGYRTPQENAAIGGAPNSLHTQGRAIDVSVAGLSFGRISQVRNDAVAQGFRVLEELYTGNGPYGYSSGPHLHLEVPNG